MGDSFRAIIAVMGPYTSFHFSTLEQYYTGGLFLGPFNGITDGSGLILLLFLIMTIAGNDFWRIPVANYKLPNTIYFIDIVVYVSTLIQVIIWIISLKNIFDHHTKPRTEGEIMGFRLNTRDLVVQIFGYFLPMIALTLLCLMGT